MTNAQQGHAYAWNGNKVLALDSGPVPRVAYIKQPWLSTPFQVRADELVPLPMAYFHGEIPR